MLSLEGIHEQDDFITQTRVRRALRANSKVRYLKKEYVFRGGAWDGEEVMPIRTRRDRGKNLVLGESDYEFSFFDFSLMRTVGGYKSIWSTHVALNRVPPGVRSLPLGLPYDSDYPFPFDIIGDVTTLREAYASSTPPPVPSEVAVMGAFAESNHPERREVREEIEKSPIGRWEVFGETTDANHMAYLIAMRESGLVACPRGVGIDTYRFWEAIYMGAVPIIKKVPRAALESLKGLPFITVESWSELRNPGRLLEDFNSIVSAKSDYERASLSNLILRFL